MASQNNFLRFASEWPSAHRIISILTMAGHNEQRTISREDAGYYYAVIVGAVYKFAEDFDPTSRTSFYYPLQRCIEAHPYLCVTIGDSSTDRSFYRRVPTIELEQHISIIDQSTITCNDLVEIEKILVSNVDEPFCRGIPPWRIIVLPLQQHYFVAFVYSHTIGDGPSAMAFHRTFLEACRDVKRSWQNIPRSIETPARPLPAPFDTPERLQISWSFLLSPLVALYIPSFFSKLLGLRVGTSKVDAGTWTSSRIFYDPNVSKTKIKLREIEEHYLKDALKVARKNEAKLTGTLLQIISRALSKAILDPDITNFVSQTSINMRGHVNIPNDEMGEFVSAAYIVHPRVDPSGRLSDEDWAAARSFTHKLDKSASTLQDQPIGLLRYLPSIRKWTLGHIGRQRETSFEVSNIGAFSDGDGVSSDSETVARITKIVFTQPGHVIGPLLTFNFASAKGGSLIYTVTWRTGTLGMVEGKEYGFVNDICSSIDNDLQALK